MGAAYSYESKHRILKIAIINLKPEEEEVVLEIIRQLHNDGELIFKSSKEETLKSYTAYSEKNKDKKTLEFFENILSKDDYSALKMGLFIRKLMEEGKPIFTYKQDIRERFGERGANIANLCTAGYFEEEFIPFYNDYSEAEFKEYYELAVGKKARALFVHSMMSAEDLENEFSQMLNKVVKYHMKNFRVHGLGNKNVNAIKEFFNKKNMAAENLFWQKKYEKKDPVIIEYVVTVLDPQ